MTIRPNSAAARDIAAALHPYTDLVTHAENGPMIIARGKGVHVWDEDGREFMTRRSAVRRATRFSNSSGRGRRARSTGC